MHYRGSIVQSRCGDRKGWWGESPDAKANDDKKYPDFGGQWKRPPGIANSNDTSNAARASGRGPA